MLDILSYPESTIGLTMIGLGEKFYNKGFQKAGRRSFKIDFASTANVTVRSFKCTPF